MIDATYYATYKRLQLNIASNLQSLLYKACKSPADCSCHAATPAQLIAVAHASSCTTTRPCRCTICYCRRFLCLL